MLLEEAAKVVKGSREETKELKALANKAGSVASSKKSRGFQEASFGKDIGCPLGKGHQQMWGDSTTHLQQFWVKL